MLLTLKVFELLILESSLYFRNWKDDDGHIFNFGERESAKPLTRQRPITGAGTATHMDQGVNHTRKIPRRMDLVAKE